MKLIDDEVNRQKQELINKCNKLKSICSGFNLVDELAILIDQMENEAKQLKSIEARKATDDYIKSLKILCNKLSGGKPLPPQRKEEPPRSSRQQEQSRTGLKPQQPGVWRMDKPEFHVQQHQNFRDNEDDDDRPARFPSQQSRVPAKDKPKFPVQQHQNFKDDDDDDDDRPARFPSQQSQTPTRDKSVSLVQRRQQIPAQETCVALFDYDGEDGELSFKAGDQITVLKKVGEWWFGELDGRKGLFPASCAKM
jgi:hypothetical protein